jgi:hypothetical protein
MDNWKAESADMHLVYSNAKLCIAATAASKVDAVPFSDRNLSMLTPVEALVEFPAEPMSIYNTVRSRMPSDRHWLSNPFVTRSEAIEASPLNQRAWVSMTLCVWYQCSAGV